MNAHKIKLIFPMQSYLRKNYKKLDKNQSEILSSDNKSHKA